MLEFLAPLTLTGLSIDLNIVSATGQPNLTTGIVRLDQLDLQINYTDGNIVAQGIVGVLQVNSYRFGPNSMYAQFDLLDAKIGAVSLPTGSTSLERLVVDGNTVDISGHFSAVSDRTVLFLDKLHLASAQWSWKLVLEAVDHCWQFSESIVAHVCDKQWQCNRPVRPAVCFDCCSNSSDHRRTRGASSSRCSYGGAGHSVHPFRTPRINSGLIQRIRNTHVPETVLVKIEGPMLNVRYNTREKLLSEVTHRLIAAEFSTYGESYRCCRSASSNLSGKCSDQY